LSPNFESSVLSLALDSSALNTLDEFISGPSTIFGPLKAKKTKGEKTKKKKK
jgi:hypothetical protein